MDMHKYYSQLIGCKIIGFKFEQDEDALSPFPVYTLQVGDQKVELALSMDEEGNGGGFAFIGDIEQ
tara:strand:+ start:95 stop:292 length:198 start_codon:yes stop_codon:yes gene_type:complete